MEQDAVEAEAGTATAFDDTEPEPSIEPDTFGDIAPDPTPPTTYIFFEGRRNPLRVRMTYGLVTAILAEALADEGDKLIPFDTPEGDSVAVRPLKVVSVRDRLSPRGHPGVH